MTAQPPLPCPFCDSPDGSKWHRPSCVGFAPPPLVGLDDALAEVGYEWRLCDACHGRADPREPGVTCAWCGGRNFRLRRRPARLDPTDPGIHAANPDGTATVRPSR